MVGSESADLHEAMLYRKLKGNSVKCGLCMRSCTIAEGNVGMCGVRKNIKRKLFSLVYGRTLTMEIDPIEKKPLFHFRPGSHCLGISTYGCNFSCLHCQNASISQQRSEEAIAAVPFISPEEIVENALASGIEGIAYTYTEPTIFAEYALDIMKLARKKGLYNVWVSNGYMSKECIDAIAPFLDAINIDLKGNERFYREVCGNASMRFVKENIALFHKKKIHQEITTLVIPGYNDNEADFKEVSEFIASIDREMPLHFTAFWPQYKLEHLPPTDSGKLRQAKEIALKAGVKFVYIGNIAGEENTLCPKCGATLVKRFGFAAQPIGLGKNGKCKKCGAKSGIIP